MAQYRLNNRGCELIGGDPGEIVTVAEVQDIWSDVMGENEDDIEVHPTGLRLIRGDERIIIADSMEGTK